MVLAVIHTEVDIYDPKMFAEHCKCTTATSRYFLRIFLERNLFKQKTMVFSFTPFLGYKTH